MKVLFVSQYFYPETFKGNDIVFDLVRRGHDVTVLTGKPNYPSGSFFGGYNFFNKNREAINGVKVVRTPIFPRGKGGSVSLIINYLSFVFFSYFTVLFRLKEKFDIVLVQQLSPITMALPGVWIKQRQKIPMVMWTLDLWPESLVATTNIKSIRLVSLIDALVKKIYDKTDVILVSSRLFTKSILNRCENKSKRIEYFPNWAEDVYTKKKSGDFELPIAPEGFNVMFAGNVGESQDFEAILEAAKLTLHSNINWVIVGDGRKLNWIRREVKNNKLSNVYLWGRYPVETMPSMFKRADVMLVSLKDKEVFSLTVPAKIQAYMASGKMIVSMLNGEGRNVIDESKCGLTCSAGNSVELVNAVITLSNSTVNDKMQMQQDAKKYYEQHFSKKMLFDKLESILNELVNI
jgi:glycosyltransferase involved in cell wall biosynthesis